MGIETAIAAGAIGSSIIGAGMQYGENRSARKRADQASDSAKTIAGAPLDSSGAIQSQINSGQDSFLQYLRANPTALKPFQFDSSKAFADLSANDNQNITDQANQLSASAGSLGARFGSGFASKSAILRSRFAGDIATRNAGIAQSSFNTALTAGMADYQSGQQRQLGLLQLLQQGQLGQRGQQLQALGFGAGLPQPGSGALVGQTGTDIATLLQLFQYLGKGGAPTGGSSTVGPSAYNYFQSTQ